MMWMKYNKNKVFFFGVDYKWNEKIYYIVMRIVMVKNYMMLIDSVIVVNIKWLDNKIMKVLWGILN